MKKILFCSILLSCFISAHAYDSHSLFGLVLAHNSESASGITYAGETYNTNLSSSFNSVGVYISGAIYPNESNAVFFLSTTLNFFPDGMLAKTNMNFDFFDSIAFSGKTLIAPALKLRLNDGTKENGVLQFSPGLAFQGEVEVGSLGTRNNYVGYSYSSFLFGLGLDTQFIIPSYSLVAFGLGLTTTYYPIYLPSISVNAESLDFVFNNYGRLQIVLIISLAINRKNL